MIFGRKKRNEAREEAVEITKQDVTEQDLTEQDVPEQPATPARNDEVTVQIIRSGEDHVNTAMATHMGTRQYQQDAAYVSEPVSSGVAFGVLCDGMGGMSSGDRASSDTVVFMVNRLSQLKPEDDVSAFLEAAAGEANDLVLAENERTKEDSGTTLIAVVVREGNLYWLNVGDSRIYILRDGEIQCLTRDHNYALELQEKVDAGFLTRAQADADPQKDALISYIGAPSLGWVDVNKAPLPLTFGDIVLLCSDGLTKVLREDEIVAVLSGFAGDIGQAAEALPAAAYSQRNGGMDNTSVILIQYLSDI